jgi:hypothetical protein
MWGKLNGQELRFPADKGYIVKAFARRMPTPVKA